MRYVCGGLCVCVCGGRASKDTLATNPFHISKCWCLPIKPWMAWELRTWTISYHMNLPWAPFEIRVTRPMSRGSLSKPISMKGLPQGKKFEKRSFLAILLKSWVSEKPIQIYQCKEREHFQNCINCNRPFTNLPRHVQQFISFRPPYTSHQLFKVRY